MPENQKNSIVVRWHSIRNSVPFCGQREIKVNSGVIKKKKGFALFEPFVYG